MEDVPQLRSVLGIFKTTFARWSADKAPKLAAALAFYSSFAMAPLLFLAIMIAGVVFGAEAARGQVVGQIEGLVGRESAESIEGILQRVNKPAKNVWMSLAGLAALLLAASGVFGELQDSLNIIWKVKKKPGRGLLGTLKDRFLSFSMVLGLGFLLLISLVITAALSALGDWLGGGEGIVTQALSFVVSFGVISALFALMFRFLPDARTPWRFVWMGGGLTALLFTAGKFAIGAYLAKSTITTTYGAAGAFLLVLLWVYYSSQILFVGAEFTKTLADRRGSRPVPDEDAVRAEPSMGGGTRRSRIRKGRDRGVARREIVIRLGRRRSAG